MLITHPIIVIRRIKLLGSTVSRGQDKKVKNQPKSGTVTTVEKEDGEEEEKEKNWLFCVCMCVPILMGKGFQ